LLFARPEADGTVWHDVAKVVQQHGSTDRAATLEAMRVGMAAAMSYAAGS
jgi:hypothetical protein